MLLSIYDAVPLSGSLALLQCSGKRQELCPDKAAAFWRTQSSRRAGRERGRAFVNRLHRMKSVKSLDAWQKTSVAPGFDVAQCTHTWVDVYKRRWCCLAAKLRSSGLNFVAGGGTRRRPAASTATRPELCQSCLPTYL